MKFFLSSVIFLLLVATGAWIFLKPQIPLDRTLVGNDGKQLACRIIGKSGDVITIVREADNKRFEMPVSRLGKRDKLYLWMLEDVEAPKEPKKTKPKPKPFDGFPDSSPEFQSPILSN